MDLTETMIKKQERLMFLEGENQKLKDLLHKWISYSDLDDSNHAINLRCETDETLNPGQK